MFTTDYSDEGLVVNIYSVRILNLSFNESLWKNMESFIKKVL